MQYCDRVTEKNDPIKSNQIKISLFTIAAHNIFNNIIYYKLNCDMTLMTTIMLFIEFESR